MINDEVERRTRHPRLRVGRGCGCGCGCRCRCELNLRGVRRPRASVASHQKQKEQQPLAGRHVVPSTRRDFYTIIRPDRHLAVDIYTRFIIILLTLGSRAVVISSFSAGGGARTHQPQGTADRGSTWRRTGDNSRHRRKAQGAADM